MAQNLERKIPDKSLVASGDNKNIQATLHKAVLLSRFGEITFLADQIKKTIEAGTKPSEITILCRENKEVREIAQLLQKFKIPVSAQVFENVFEDPHVMNLIQMLQIFANPTLDHEFLHLLHAKFWDVEDKILFDLSIAARKTPIAKLLQEHPDFENIINLFITGKREHAQSSPVKIAESLFHDSGLFVFLAREENLTKTADLLRIQKFLDWIKLQESKGTKTLPALLEKIQAHQELNLSLRADPLPTDKNAVGIMTAHRSKGSEFDVVFIPGLLDRVWGNRRSRAGIPLPELFHSLQDDNEEERRLFFVALTRARKQIFLSHSEKDFSGRDRLMSEFWHEIPDDTCEIIASEKSEEHAQNLLPIFFSTQAPAFTGEEEEMLKNLAAKHVWSASSLQDFLDCPRKFLYTRLLRFPLPPNKHMSLGTALHSALEDLLKQFQQQQKLPSLEQLLASFREHISRQWLSGAEREECVLHGTELLKNYHEKCAQTLSSDVLLEFNFSSHHVKINNIPVTGKVDKIELGPDKKAILVDYKTGRPKSIKKDDRYWRQLVFYDLMARHAKNLDFQIEKCVLEFLTPDAKGNLMRKEVAITEEDRAQVIQELKDCHEQLQNLNFPILDNLEQDSEMDYWQKLGI